MVRNRILVSLLIVASFLLMQSSCVTRTIVFATDPTYPPLEYLDAQQQQAGFDIDLVTTIADSVGFQAEIKAVSWDSIFNGLDAGMYDAVISGVTITENRAKVMDFSVPYLRTGQRLLVMKDAPYSDLNDLSGKVVAFIWEPSREVAMKQAATFGFVPRQYDNIETVLSALCDGKVDAFLVDDPIALYYAGKGSPWKNQFRTLGEAMTEEYYGIAVKKGNSDVLRMIDAGLKKAQDSGKIEELKQKWFG